MPSIPSISRATGLLLLLLLLVFFSLRLPGFTWGLPGAGHRWPYSVDETFPFVSLARMSPGRMEFNPHQPYGGHGYIYTVGAILMAGDLVGALDLPSSKEELKSRPEDLRRAYLAPRLLALFADACTTVFVGLLAARCAGPLAGWIAALLYASTPLGAFLAHFGNYFSTVMAVTSAALLLLLQAHDRGCSRRALVSGILIGYGVSCMWLAALFAPVIFFLPHSPRRGQLVAAFLGGLAAGFVLTAPFLILGLRETLEGLLKIRSIYVDKPAAAPAFTRWPAALALLRAAGPLALAAAAAGGVVMLRQYRATVERAALAPFVLAAVVLLAIGSGLARHYAVLLPGIAALAGIFIAGLPRGWRAAGAGLVLTVNVLLSVGQIWPLATPDSRSKAEEWIRANIPPGSSIIGANWYFLPHLPMDQYPVTMLWGHFNEQYRDVEHRFALLTDHDGFGATLERADSYAAVTEFRCNYPRWLAWTVSDFDPADLRTARPIITIFEKK